MTRQPIEPLIRDEDFPEDTVVVIRGGPIAAAKIVDHARRQEAVFTYRGEPMAAISVDLALDGWPVDRILAERMWSRSTYALSTVGVLRGAGFDLVPTSTQPHYSVVLPEATEADAQLLLDQFGPTMVNEHRRQQRR
jgi:hypothetical protein